MKHRVTIESNAEENAHSAELTAQSGERVLEFETVESAIRLDAAGIEVPAGLRERVMKEVDTAPVRRSWWKRWIG